jgi:hypothetical protein
MTMFPHPGGGAVRHRMVITAVVAVLIAGFVALLYQAPVAQWGSTPGERAARMVGDEVVADADTAWTRSITIGVPPKRVWPWLVQMGVDKGGFYNYDWASSCSSTRSTTRPPFTPSGRTCTPATRCIHFPTRTGRS